MTDQPKPTPQWSILCDEARGRPRCLIVDKDGNEVAAVNPYRQDWNEVSELIARAPELQQRVDELERALDFRVKYTNAQKGAIETFTADNQRLRELLRRVADAAERDDWGSIGPELLEEVKHAIGRTGE